MIKKCLISPHASVRASFTAFVVRAYESNFTDHTSCHIIANVSILFGDLNENKFVVWKTCKFSFIKPWTIRFHPLTIFSKSSILDVWQGSENTFNATDFNKVFSKWWCVKSAQIRSFFWSVFSRIRTEYEDLLRNTDSVEIRENRDQKNSVFGHFFAQWSCLRNKIKEWIGGLSSYMIQVAFKLNFH